MNKFKELKFIIIFFFSVSWFKEKNLGSLSVSFRLSGSFFKVKFRKDFRF